MLTQHRQPVYLSLMSHDLPIWSVVETNATLYQKDQERFHVLLTEPLIQDFQPDFQPNFPLDPQPEIESSSEIITPATPRLIWLEISPYRVIMTMQGNGQFSYRHFWEQGVYGISRYWLQTNSFGRSQQMRLKNFTRHLFLTRKEFPQHLRVDYELWASQVKLGHYVLNLEILN